MIKIEINPQKMVKKKERKTSTRKKKKIPKHLKQKGLRKQKKKFQKRRA